MRETNFEGLERKLRKTIDRKVIDDLFDIFKKANNTNIKNPSLQEINFGVKNYLF